MTKRSTKRCLFCDAQGKLTGEHPLGRWALEYIEADGWRTGFSVSRPASPDGKAQAKKKVRDRAGDPARQQVWSACKACNTGWMSRLQEAVIPVALPFIKGGFPVLSSAEASSLAAWAVMATMNFEHHDPETAMVPPWQRDELRKTEAAPNGWYVGIARFNGQTPSGCFWHRAQMLGEQSTKAEAPVIHARAQMTVFPLGKLLVHTFSADSTWAIDHFLKGGPAAYGNNIRLRTIWPAIATTFVAESGSIKDADVAAIMDQFGKPTFTGFQDPPAAGGAGIRPARPRVRQLYPFDRTPRSR